MSACEQNPKEKAATLTLALRADSGYEADAAYRINAEQWAEVLGVCEGTRLSLADQTRDSLDAKRYRALRRGQAWSVIDGIGDDLRGEALDAAIDAREALNDQPQAKGD